MMLSTPRWLRKLNASKGQNTNSLSGFDWLIKLIDEIKHVWRLLLQCKCFTFRRWTRREEADFYRVVSTFGVVFDPNHSRFDWTKFRAMARLHKKTDESLQKYLCAFTAMCRRVCRLPPKEGGQRSTCSFTQYMSIKMKISQETMVTKTLKTLSATQEKTCTQTKHNNMKKTSSLL